MNRLVSLDRKVVYGSNDSTESLSSKVLQCNKREKLNVVVEHFKKKTSDECCSINDRL